MHPAASLIAENALQHQHLFVPLLFLVCVTAAQVHGPVQHSLLVAAVSWALIWVLAIFRAGVWSSSGNRSRKTTSWLAGGLLALAQICDRAACDKEGIWSTKGLLPLLAVLVSENEFWSKHTSIPSYFTPDDSPIDSSLSAERSSRPGYFRLLAVVTVSAAAALATRFTTSPTSTLGLSSVIFTATGLVLFENALKTTKDDTDSGGRGLMSANGTFSRRDSMGGAQKEQQLASLRDVAAVITIICGIATYLMEPVIKSDAMTWEPIYRQLPGDWKTLHYHRTVQQVLLMICVDVLANILLFFMLSQQGAVRTSFLSLFSYICARLHVASSFSSIWFTIIFSSTGLLFLYNSSTSAPVFDSRASMRLRRIIFVITSLSIGLLFLRYASGARHYTLTTNGSVFNALSPEMPFAPVPIDSTKGHPAQQLIGSAGIKFQKLLNRQSKSLGEAAQEYRRRNGVAPPPHFDKWYEFATRNNVQLIDEFDTITHSLLPFWGLKPSTIRTRVKNVLGHEDNAMVGIMVRDGDVVKIEGGQEWQQQATAGMMKDFVQYLPDMDLAFNIHDEPRVVVPNDELSILVAKAQDEIIPAAMKTKSPRNSFSSRPPDTNDGKRFEEAKTTRFNRFAHQQTWTHARLSCPISSQARYYEDNAADNLTTYAAGPLNYIYNQTAFSDICNSPSLATSFGFFERPNAFSIIYELTPIFSQSKVSSFQDILYPSPWYWFGKVGYDEDHDTSWENKTNSLYWRGSTTGGFSRNGGWRKHHRQHIVKRLNAHGNPKVLVNKGDENTPLYEVEEVDRNDINKMVDVKFSHIGQCDPGDCDAQKEFFDIVERVDGQDAWWFKHLLDMDGNAFSGRFYAFLRSKSLTYKMAIFREWHQEWLLPWVHYVPLSLIGDEHLDLVRWFGGGGQPVSGEDGEKDGKRKVDENKGGNGDSIGEKRAREIAERSSEWAGKVLRNVDFEAWFFRLLLEYGRIIDDDRDSIGYPGP
ncbi:glycosyltransferase family 90 protein [Melanomma pulvis-pyrius CBS 109.77]|uniref:Glycosyltransferase family 90 protein n=1 Tax=Melanomma pulvis-pyrius CBS 109.77 TaxID=1314802 RepID=A0A6A6X3D2_9PLEO|nr:glycosyltransferase family 90 protein [Melanomma pulvis-pyrius CBS 109.77]